MCHCEDRIAEIAADHDELVAELREAWERELALLNRMLDRSNQVRAVVMDTPALARKRGMDGYDPRLHEWLRQTEDALAADPIPPCLSPQGEARLEEFSNG